MPKRRTPAAATATSPRAGSGPAKPRSTKADTARKTSARATRAAGAFTAEERAAMQARARELKAEARADRDRAAGERDVLAAIAAMPPAERALVEHLHRLVLAAAPALVPKTWYGMPAYARDGQVVCFVQAASKFGTRYATLGFSDKARLDDGDCWPTSFAVTALTDAIEARLADLVRRAAG